MPTFDETMAELERYGTPNIRKIFIRHGVGENLFGVKYGDIKPLAKRIKTDHALALKLWDSENHDARILAGMIADPRQATPEMLETWGRTVKNKAVCDEISKFAVKTPYARVMAEKWAQDPDEWISTAGWDLLGQIALKDATLPDAYFEPYLAQIERELHQRPNYTRYAMNGAMIAIGTRSPALYEKALAAAATIGEVIVDHGQTECETPDARTYMQNTVEKRGFGVR